MIDKYRRGLTPARLLASPEAKASYRNSVLFRSVVDFVDYAERHGDQCPIATLGRMLATAMDGKAEWEATALQHLMMNPARPILSPNYADYEARRRSIILEDWRDLYSTTTCPEPGCMKERNHGGPHMAIEPHLGEGWQS